jgi:hypothetical protein
MFIKGSPGECRSKRVLMVEIVASSDNIVCARMRIFNSGPKGRDVGQSMDETQEADNLGAEPADETREALTPAAKRALAEAEERRKHREAEEKAAPREIGGRGGEDPARFGDWEVKGLAVDF